MLTILQSFDPLPTPDPPRQADLPSPFRPPPSHFESRHANTFHPRHHGTFCTPQVPDRITPEITSQAAVATLSFPFHGPGAGSGYKICLESPSSVVLVHLPVPGTRLSSLSTSLSGECSPFLSFSFIGSRWSSSYGPLVRCDVPRPKESLCPFQPVILQSPPSQLSPPSTHSGSKQRGVRQPKTISKS